MDCKVTRLPYRQTNSFTKTVLDFIDQAAELKPFFSHAPNLQGVQDAIRARKQFNTNRKLLVEHFNRQYTGVELSEKVKANIDSLLSSETFTITTAHQNNIFTGPLYFIYKIIHAIKLADHLSQTLQGQHFVPVFYIGTEDADLEELNHVYVGGEKLSWNTKQTGAVGRMKIDKELVKLIGAIEGQLSVLPQGEEISGLLKKYYKEGQTIQEATFQFVNRLFGEYGLLVLLPDHAELKAELSDIFEDDLLNQTASGIVENTAAKLDEAGYKVQANPREINLFYLLNDKRDRIEKLNEEWKVVGTDQRFSKDSLLKELKDHPGHFSPNVILRGLYQETILPNIAFIGGGGETAYWLQLKDLFEHYKVPFPVLVLRNSFLLVERKWQEKIAKLGFDTDDLFLSEDELMKRLVKRESKNETKLNGSLTSIGQLYEEFKKQAAAVDTTLEKHVDALRTQAVYRLHELEKKMLRAEKRKFSDQQRQLHAVKEHLFPGNGLQERKENLAYYYAQWGNDFLHKLYDHSPALEQEFVIITEK